MAPNRKRKTRIQQLSQLPALPSLPAIVTKLASPPTTHLSSVYDHERKRVYDNTAPAKMAVAEDILKDPYFADLDIDLSQFSEEEKTVILGVMQKAKVSVDKS